MAVCTPWTVVCRSSLMSLIITFMLEPAKLQMNWARARGTSTLRKALDGRPPVPCSAMVHLLPLRAVTDRRHRARAPTPDTCRLYNYLALSAPCQPRVRSHRIRSPRAWDQRQRRERQTPPEPRAAPDQVKGPPRVGKGL